MWFHILLPYHARAHLRANYDEYFVLNKRPVIKKGPVIKKRPVIEKGPLRENF